jgi:hypothetical protein
MIGTAPSAPRPANGRAAITAGRVVYYHDDREDDMGTLVVTERVTLDGVAQTPAGPDDDRDGGFVTGDGRCRGRMRPPPARSSSRCPP